MTVPNNSEVATLLLTIETEYTAACNGLYGYASGVARHDFITAKMERLEVAKTALVEKIGEDAAWPLIIEAIGKPS